MQVIWIGILQNLRCTYCEQTPTKTLNQKKHQPEICKKTKVEWDHFHIFFWGEGAKLKLLRIRRRFWDSFSGGGRPSQRLSLWLQPSLKVQGDLKVCSSREWFYDGFSLWRGLGLQRWPGDMVIVNLCQSLPTKGEENEDASPRRVG